MPGAEEFRRRRERVGAFEINIESYRTEKGYFCRVDNADPGAVIARATAATREEAEATAIEKARRRIAGTRVFD